MESAIKLIEDIDRRRDLFTRWRRDLHAHPELAFNEFRTAKFVAEKLAEFGVEVHAGMAETGVVGVLRSGSGNKAIGLRADMDALPIIEKNTFSHCSKHEGKMHACGHDGHTVMLLAAAQYLAEQRNFSGTVYFVFQPAEENEGGAKAMIEEGLFERYPMDSVYALHNAPGMKAGMIGTRPDAFLASMDLFEVVIKGAGTHAATPHLAVDPVLIGAHLVTAWQSIVSRYTSPLEPAVLSATSISAGDTWNVIPEQAVIKGSVRCFSPELRERIRSQFHQLTGQIVAGFGAKAEIFYRYQYPPTINSPEYTRHACAVAADLLGESQVIRGIPPVMGSDDFAFMLEKKPGCYLWVGNGEGSQGGCMLHDPNYDFNDDIISIGASFWVRLVESSLI